MPTFTYQARDEAGRLVRGILEAESKVMLADRLRKMGYLVTRMEEGVRTLPDIRQIRFGRAVSSEQFLLVMVELANLIEAGIPLVSALNAVATQCKPGPLKEALEGSAKEIEGGKSFSEVLARRPRVFPKLMVSMVAVGESSGKLDVVLQRLAQFIEKDLTLKRTVQGALTYPLFLLLMSLGLVVFVVSFVVPQFTSLFIKAGLSLPAPTLLVSRIGWTIRAHGWLLVFLGSAGFAGASWALHQPVVRRRVDAVLWRLPGVGTVIQQTLTARLARSLATLIGSGIPILNALETAAGVSGNHILARELIRTRSAVERGERISVALSVGEVFHADVIQMIRAGEESGRLDVMLEKVADFYDLRVSFMLKQMMTLLEPALLIVMGVVVAFIMASLLLPMFELVKVLHKGGIR